LQARYFDKDKLVDISYDKRLAETIWILFRNFPFYWGEKELKKFVGVIKRNNLDLGDSFERLYRRISSQLSAKEKWQNKEYQPIAKLGKGRFITHDRHKKILNDSYNWKLLEVALLCKRGQFDEARTIAQRFNKDQTIKRVINNYCRELFKGNFLTGLNKLLQKTRGKRLQVKVIALSEAELLPKDPIFLAPDFDSPGINQPIPAIAPPPLPPDQDPDKDKEQEENRKQTKKKNSRPEPPEKKRIKKSQEEHNWSDRSGHLVKTSENIKLVENVANDPECYCGPPDKHGNHWYAKILKDGKQVWTRVRDNEIVAWGINKPENIREYNPETGPAALKAPSQKTPKTPRN